MDRNVQEKKDFFHWVIQTFKFQQREAFWIITYLLKHDAILKKIHIVEHAEKTPRGIVFSVQDMENSVILFLDGLTFKNPEQIFHEIRMNWKKDLYLSCVFPGTNEDLEYVRVLENNPYFSWNEHIDEEIIQQVEEFIEQEKQKNEQAKLYQRIDEALENGDVTLFHQLTSELKTLI